MSKQTIALEKKSNVLIIETVDGDGDVAINMVNRVLVAIAQEDYTFTSIVLRLKKQVSYSSFVNEKYFAITFNCDELLDIFYLKFINCSGADIIEV